jgi:hypothetical protein
VWRFYPFGSCYNTRWLTGLWSTHEKMEGVMPMTAWQWGRDSSVVNHPLREQDRTPLRVGIPSAWVSMDGVLCFSPFCRRALF